MDETLSVVDKQLLKITRTNVEEIFISKEELLGQKQLYEQHISDAQIKIDGVDKKLLMFTGA